MLKPSQKERTSISEITIIGIDLAKRVFQLHGARGDGSVVFRKKLSWGQVLAFVSQQSRCVVAMEACATAHGWGAFLRHSGLRHDSPFPLQHQATRTMSAVPRAEKRFMSAMRIWISAVWRFGSLSAMRSPKAFRQRIFASARLLT